MTVSTAATRRPSGRRPRDVFCAPTDRIRSGQTVRPNERQLRRWLTRIREEMTSAPRTDLDQCPATVSTIMRRLKLLGETSETVLLLGDDDLLGLALTEMRARSRVVVLDADENLVRVMRTHGGEAGLKVLRWDLRDGLPKELRHGFDGVFTDPPYTLAGQLLFVHRGMMALRSKLRASLYVCASPAYLSKDQLDTVRSFLSRGGFQFSARHRKFNKYKAPPDVSRDLTERGVSDSSWLYSDLYHYVRRRPADVPRLPPRTLQQIYSYNDVSPA